MYKIAVYVPSDSLEQVKQALFDQGAGRLGNYDHCSWQVLGQGQFRPLSGSHPTLGQQGKLETVEEYLVEMICDETAIKRVIAALRREHPYEEPAYTVSRLETVNSD